MSLVENILTILNYSSDYPKIYALLSNPDRLKISNNLSNTTVSENTLRVTLSRLKKKGFVENRSGMWRATSKGLAHLNKIQKKVKLPSGVSKKSQSKYKKIIIVFDIPEDQRQKRTWLRSALLKLDFQLLQKSVWLGPSPLPKDFIKFLHDLKLLPYIKFLRVSEDDVA